MRVRLAIATWVFAVSTAGPLSAQEPMLGAEQTETAPGSDLESSLSYVVESPAEPDETWQFTVAPYLIFPFMNGSVTLADQKAEVDFTPKDIFKRLNWGLMLYFEATHPKFAIATDVLYMNLGQGKLLPVSGRSADLTMQQLAAEVIFLGRIVKWFELGAGGRVNFVQSGLTAPAGAVLPALDLDFRETWFDPLVVTRFSVPFSNDHWRLGLRADVGGFTLGSTYAWQVYPYGSYNFDGVKDRRLFALGAAFRAIGMKYETGSGLNRFVYDMIIWGPELGFLFHF